MLWSALKTGYNLKAFSELETELNIIQDGDGDAPPMATSWLTTVRQTLGMETWLGTSVLYSNCFKMQPLIEKIQDVSMFTGEQRTWWASRTPCVCATQPCAMRRMTRVQLQIWPQDLSAYFWHLLWLFWFSTDNRSVYHIEILRLELSEESMTQPDVFPVKLILNQSVLILQLCLDSLLHILSSCHYASVMQS